MTQVVLASSNQGKVNELQELLTPYALNIVPQSAFKIQSAEETGTTFVENAIIKARHAAQQTGLSAIADDSGLSVPALDGAPGVYSARYSGVEGNDERNNQKLLQALKNVPMNKRQACFHCVLVYMRHSEDPIPLICHGQWQGTISTELHGANGFGYDPLFIPDGYQQSSAELSRAQKNAISHRAMALKLLVEQLGNLC
ncbi:RdgB/HAM1 family non-canonical purine NTP pyrophosphatase [Celerinatantimonas diazotrophica]|uniref:dITP/XTP pyrophosphatase n=1 Tax=Celerinatantimonas diazotrophica TaxID=412034 RepID=A0A4R1JAW8_9GAMM|nr:RdgB/HAM1 family non-canonical purine NTP pyrophosphatase [Celerinatantimonas diazotrophica]TCK47249.1 XTP/dITP diphosphohydrolase [Celerinatantimonas diazotrophica]CAG9296021.1 dITP/XTP pyrophosphatase [Celerinatantimonas diazotrophica]